MHAVRGARVPAEHDSLAQPLLRRRRVTQRRRHRRHNVVRPVQRDPRVLDARLGVVELRAL